MGSDYIIWEGIFIKVFEMGYGEEIFLKISSPQSFHNLCVLFFCPSSRKIRFAVASPCPPFLFRYASISEAYTTGQLLSIERRLSIVGVRGWLGTDTNASPLAFERRNPGANASRRQSLRERKQRVFRRGLCPCTPPKGMMPFGIRNLIVSSDTSGSPAGRWRTSSG